MTALPATETFSAAVAVELAVVERSGFVESRHSGSAVVVGPDGALLRELGDAEAPVFPRSTLKALQAVAVLAAGAQLRGEQLAIAQASHRGTPAHVALVRELLADAGLDDSHLGCPADWPLDRAARDALIRAGEAPSPVFMNCSGKHAAMLAACVQQGWPLDGYTHPEHPLQQLVRTTVERLSGARPAAVGVDGCGAPVFALPLISLARALARMRTANPASPFPLFRNSAAVLRAALAHGWVIDGPGKPDALVIDELGVYAKTGAEGVLVLAAPDGTTAALKVLDGSTRAATVVGLQLLVAAGAVAAEAASRVVARLELAVTGGGAAVGRIRPADAVSGRLLRQ